MSIPEIIIKWADLKEGLKFIKDEEVDVIIMDQMYGKALMTDKRLRYHWCLSVILQRQSRHGKEN